VWRFVLLAIFRIFNGYEIAGSSILSEQFKRIPQDLLLQVAHVGAAKTVSDFESFGIERAWWPHLRRDFWTNSNQDGRNTLHFDFTLDRHDRAVANARSTSGEHHRIGTRTLVNMVGDFARGAFVHGFQLHRVAHVPDVLLCDTAN
jgi:hypothetical protein